MNARSISNFIIKIKIFLTKKQKKIVILKKNGIKNKAKIALTSKLLGISVPSNFQSYFENLGRGVVRPPCPNWLKGGFIILSKPDRTSTPAG